MSAKRPAECLTSFVEHAGRRYSLCCVRHHYRGEGDAVLEQLSRDDKPDGEPAFTDFQALGRWYVRSPDEGPSTLRVEFDSVDDLDDSTAIINKLLAALGDGPWGVDAVEALS